MIEVDIEDLLKSGIDAIEYQYFLGLKNRTLILNEDITTDIIEKIIIPLINMDNDKSETPIRLYVCSYGGDIWSGMVLSDVIDKLKSPLEIIGMGACMSMGLLILMSGKNNPNVKRYCYPSTVGLLHAGSIALGQTDTNQAKDFMDFNNKYQENKIKQHIIRNSKINDREYKKFARKEKYLDAEEMLAYEIVDEIL